MKPPRLKELIDRYLKDDVTPQERQFVDLYYHSYDENEPIISPEKEEQLKKDIYNHIKGKIDKPAAKVRNLHIARYAVAAVAMLFVTAAILSRKKANQTVHKESFTIIKTGAGQVRKLELPDKSTVWINAMSSIRISDDFQSKTNRSIFLDEGEAFFEVQKNPSRPFFVITGSITTKVLGTSFNVKAYRSLNDVKVTVKTGRVQVNNQQRTIAVLVHDQQLSYAVESKTAQISKVYADASRGWIMGNTLLNNASFNDLSVTVKNLYGIQLISKKKATNTYKYTLNINSSRTIDETMRVICSVHQNNFRRKNNEVIIY